MAELFSTFADFKSFVGGRINTSIQLESLEPTIYDTARRHIVPWLGLEFYEAMVTAAAGDTPEAEETALFPYIKKPLALLTLYEYLKVGGVEVGESGIHRVESENRKSAFRYQEKLLSESVLEHGYDALEQMLLFLDREQSTYTDWRDSEEGQRHLSSLLNYAKDFRLLTSHQCDRYTFEALRPILADVEVWGAEKLLPAGFWDGFKSRYLDNDLSDAEKVVLKYMRNAFAHRALEQATSLQWVQIRSGRIYVVEEFGEQSQINRTMPTTGGGSLYFAHGVWSDRHTQRWIDYINANSGDFETVFDVASGGTNTDTDAWHINTDDEQTEADTAAAEAQSKGVFLI